MSNNTGYEMPEIDLDLSGQKAWGGEQGPKLPIGAYTMDVVNVEEVKSAKKQTPGVEVTFKVADEGLHFGTEIKKTYYLSEKALGRITNLMVACGARLDKIRLGDLMGARIIVEIVHVPGQAQLDAQGNMVASTNLYCDITREQAIAAPEPAPAPPPAARKAALAPAPAAQQAPVTKNGSVARRA